MNQPEQPTPARGTRPQLFGAPRERQSQQPDFGPSILATIDGVPRREARGREGVPIRRALTMAVLAIVLVAVYAGYRLSARPAGPASGEAAPHVVSVAKGGGEAVIAVPATPPGSAPVSAPAMESRATGGATIENVVPPVVVAAASQPAASATTASNAATSLQNIQQVLARTEPAEAARGGPSVPVKEAPKEPARDVPKETLAMRGSAEPAPAPAKPPAKAGGDSDADLLAAMLPHLKRRATTPTSPAFEKRCGQYTGDAALDCRAKFCTGREGNDPACPGPAPAAAR